MGLFDLFKQKKEDKNNLYLYNEEDLKKYEAYITKEFGKYDEVFHEIYSPDIHLDIIFVPPTKENNYYKLITMGMGAYKMNVPKELKEYELERAELVLYLPPTWDIKSSKEEDYWPIRQLKVLARLPINCNTWLGYGHTVSGSEDNSPYASNTKFCSMGLLNAVNNNAEHLDFRLESKEKINFYHVFPLYKEELKFKMENSMEKLLENVADFEDLIIVNNDRKPII